MPYQRQNAPAPILHSETLGPRSVSVADGHNGSTPTVSTALGIYGIEPHTPPSPEIRERETMKTQVLSRKATERTQMLKASSRELIDTSRKLLSECKSRKAKALRS